MSNSVWPMWQENKPFALLLLILIVYLIVFFGVKIDNELKSTQLLGQADTPEHTISVTGEADSSAVPDIATLRLGYVAEAETVSDAQTENVEAVNQMIAAVKRLGIDSEDIKTQDFSVSPMYTYEDGKREQTGFQVSQQVTVTVRNTDLVSTILEQSAEYGLNRVSGPDFTLDDPDAAYQEVRLAAIEDAFEEANELAAALGVSLGKVIGFYENTNQSYPRAYAEFADVAALGFGGAAPEIEVGSTELSASVTILFQIP